MPQYFVGRKTELKRLDDHWVVATTGRTSYKRVYAVLNAPGVGKTELLEQFGEKLMKAKKGLMVEINVKTTSNKILSYYLLILKEIRLAIKDNKKLIKEYVAKKVSEEFEIIKGEYKKQYPFDDEEEANSAIQNIEKTLNKMISQFEELETSLHVDQEFLANLPDLFPRLISDLSIIIPVFLFIDEVQVLQSLSYLNNKKEEETFLHVCSKELADLLPTKTLIVVSGTQYRLMKQIGNKIGSPLRGKVKHFVIHPLESENIKEYYHLISKYFIKENKQKSSIGTIRSLKDIPEAMLVL